MKHHISKFLKSLAIFFIGFPVFYIVLAAALYDIPFNKCVGVLLSPFYYGVSLCVVFVGYGFWEMKRWSWYLFLLSQVFIGYENAILVNGYAESHHKILIFIVGSLLQIGLVFRVAREVRVPYFFPRIRWWESNPMYRLSVPVNLDWKLDKSLDGEILDLSLVGCFIKLRADLAENEHLVLKFNIYGYELKCEGKVVWCAQSAVTHPKGIGVKFNILTRTQRRSLRVISRKLKKVSKLYRTSRYLMSQEEFLKNLKLIEGEKSLEMDSKTVTF